MSAAERHRRHAGAFTALVAGTADWSAPAPVPGWTAGDVVDHLLLWFPDLLQAGAGIEVPGYRAGEDDRDVAWPARCAAVQALLDDPAMAQRRFAHPQAGEHALADAIDMFYTTDVFLHSWDLARAGGQQPAMPEQECAELLAGMEPLDELLRSSGQYGPRVPVADGASAQDRLIGFIGRDPAWRAG